MFEEELDERIKALPIFKDNQKFLKDLIEYNSTRIETENPAILRAQISEAFSYIAFLRRLRSRAEALYRIAQKNAAQTTSKEFKAQAREAVLNGETAQYRYARDLFQDYIDVLDDKLVSSRAILTSLDNELKRMPSD